MNSTDVALHEGQHRDMQIQSPIGNDPTGGRLVAWAEGLAAAHRIGSALCGTTFVPQHFRGKPEEAAAAILYGDEIGFTPTQALQNLYVIGGKPALYARAMVALVQASGHAVWTVEKSDESVTVAGIRRGTQNEVRETWTVARAQRAGYTNNKKYQTDPQAMLYARAASDVCRQIAADVLAGIGYSVEEMQLADEPAPAAQQRPTGLDAVRAKVAHQTDAGAAEPPQASPQEPAREEASDGRDAVQAPASPKITASQQRKLFALFKAKGITEEEQLPGIVHVIGRPIESRTAMTPDEFEAVVKQLEARDDALAQDAHEGGEQE